MARPSGDRGRGGWGGRGPGRLSKGKGGRGSGSSSQQRHQQTRQHHPARISVKPPSFSGFRGPSDRFVEEAHPQFQEIVSTCYAGFHVEAPEALDAKVHEEARQAFDSLEEGGVFRADVTQPFGLGTKCAVTYVTRTLVGDPGTTYKYLGLRMFSHPWTTTAKEADPDGGHGSGVPSALRRVGLLNDKLKERSLRLLRARGGGKGKARRERGEGDEFGSCEFNVALINRMEPSDDRPDLKLEPTFGQDRCSVSWHADSCLENYSSIAVYHVTDPETKNENANADGGDANPAVPANWRIALRVEPDAEGPSGGKLKLAATVNESSRVDRAPAVAVALPSRSAYFLLDDFNHHHQHAVLAGQSHRWSSTHRVAKKQGHSFDYISGRCRTVLGDGHRRTLKQWKTEQLTLAELEFEWIRQFYVQGRAHHALHSWWHGPLQVLLRFWSLLEAKTAVVVNTLQGAAEWRFDHHQQQQSGVGVVEAAGAGADDKREKKARQKRVRQRQAVESLGGRVAYSAIAEALGDRAEKRRQWAEREKDKVFERLPADSRPMSCPLSPSFSSSADSAVSTPLPRTPEALSALADAVLEWGKIFSGEDGVRGGGIVAAEEAGMGGGGRRVSGDCGENESGGTGEKPARMADSGACVDNGSDGQEPCGSSTSDGSSLPSPVPTFPAGAESARHAPPTPWETGRFALEMQAPWSRRLLDGEKTVETRGYPLPAGLVGRSIEVLESGRGRDGVSGVGDVVEAFSAGLSVVGRVVFGGTEAYPSREAWAADAERHLVPVPAEEEEGPESGKGYGWKGPESVHAWRVASVEAYPKPRAVRRMGRVFRSLFLVEQAKGEQPAGGGGGGGGGGDDNGAKPEGSIGARAADGRPEIGGDEGKRKRKPKKKRKRKGPPAGGVLGSADAAPGTAVSEKGKPLAASSAAVETPNATAAASLTAVSPPGGAKGGSAEKPKTKRPRHAANGRQGAVSGEGNVFDGPASGGEESLSNGSGSVQGGGGVGGGGGDGGSGVEESRSGRGGKGKRRRGGKGSEEQKGLTRRGGEEEMEDEGVVALAAAAAAARSAGGGFDVVVGDGWGAVDAPGVKPADGEMRKKHKRKKKRY
ncbi:unnamed protein product [Ectocarpus sp. 4 AP-2014]